ncbi:MAG: T9SS type A sorting domain-containing protein [Flavobacteriaceae bacterium]
MIKKITLLILTTITSVLYAQTTIGESSLFATTTNPTWTHVFTAATTADGVAVSGPAQTVVINITSLPDGSTYRIYKTTSSGAADFSQQGDLAMGENTITVPAANFNRAVKFQFSGEGLIEFDSFSHNGVVLYPVEECGPDDNIIGTSNLFVSQEGQWPYSLTLASIDDGNMGEVHSFTMDVTCLPAGGAQYRILKTGPNGDITCCNGDLSLGLNTKNVAANGGWTRNVRFWFSSGDIGFSSITSNGSALGLQEINYALVKIHPNPATNFLTISGVNNIDSVKVYSVLGRLEKEVFNTHQIDISHLASGVYMVKVSDGSNVISKKFIKQ